MGVPPANDRVPINFSMYAAVDRKYSWLFRRYDNFSCLRDDPVSGQGARSGTSFTRSSEPASWIA